MLYVFELPMVRYQLLPHSLMQDASWVSSTVEVSVSVAVAVETDVSKSVIVCVAV